MKKGTVCITLDTELLWGVFDLRFDFRESAKKVRYVLNKILALAEQYDLPLTFALVGHLFLDQCKKINGKKHPSLTRPDYDKEWFRLDPSTNLKKNPLWYGKDILDLLKKEKKHEIASHSFSHIEYKKVNKGCAKSDLDQCLQLAKKENLDLKSFVFPRNEIAHLGLLKEKNFICYRGENISWSNQIPFPKALKRIFHISSYILTLKPPVFEPQLDKYGLVNIPGSMIYLSMDGFRKFIPLSVRVKRVKKGIQEVAKRKKCFHLWFHPINLGNKTDELLRGLEEIFAYIYKLKSKGQIEVKTMAQVAKSYVDKKPAINLHDKEAELFNKRYENYNKNPYLSSFTYGRKCIHEIIFKYLKDKHGKLLDIGCGTGFDLSFFSKLDFDCFGIDPSENMIRIAKSNAPNCQVSLGNVSNLKFKSNSFDYVISVEVFRYLRKKDKAIQEVHRVLKKNGTAILTFPSKYSLNLFPLLHRISLSLKKYFSSIKYSDVKQTFYTASEIKDYLQKNGFTKIKIIPCHFFPSIYLEKISPKLHSFIMKFFELLDKTFSKISFLNNLSNHFVVIAKK